jgi:DNA-binding MarR family transcriptional regulator
LDNEALTRLRQAVSHLARQLNKSATDENLTPSQASVLGVIAGSGPIGLPELTRLEGLNPTMLSRMISKLDEAGYIVRTTLPNDQRAVVVEVTDAGLAIHSKIHSSRADVVAQAVRRLPPGQQQSLTEALPALEALLAELRGAK